MAMSLSRRLARTIAGSRTAMEVHQNVFCAVLVSAGSRSSEFKELLLQEVFELLQLRLARARTGRQRDRLKLNLATIAGCRRAH